MNGGLGHDSLMKCNYDWHSYGQSHDAVDNVAHIRQLHHSLTDRSDMKHFFHRKMASVETEISRPELCEIRLKRLVADC